MEITRRSFLQLGGLALATSLVPRWANGAAYDPGEIFDPLVNEKAWPIIQGPTDERTTSFVILHPSDKKFYFRFSNGLTGAALSKFRTESWNLPGSKLTATEIFLAGLVPGIAYNLKLLDEDGLVFDTRSFGSLDLKAKTCRFAIASCMYDQIPVLANPMWKAMYEEQPDFVVLLGDTCYSDMHNDKKDEPGYAYRYAQSRHSISFFRMPRLTPIFATWDDHDFGLNNSSRSFPRKHFTKQLFRKFWGNNVSASWKTAHGVGSVFRGFGQRFYLMDDRFDRDDRETRNGRHWGRDQTDWVLDDLASSDEPAWIMNGSQVYGGYLGKESMEGDHPGDLKDIVNQLAKIKAPVVFASGDVHYSEIMKIEESQLGYETREFTSSSMHSTTMPGSDNKKKNPRRLISEWRYNFLLFNVDTRDGWKINSRCVMAKNQISFEQNFFLRR